MASFPRKDSPSSPANPRAARRCSPRSWRSPSRRRTVPSSTDRQCTAPWSSSSSRVQQPSDLRNRLEHQARRSARSHPGYTSPCTSASDSMKTSPDSKMLVETLLPVLLIHPRSAELHAARQNENLSSAMAPLMQDLVSLAHEARCGDLVLVDHVPRPTSGSAVHEHRTSDPRIFGLPGRDRRQSRGLAQGRRLVPRRRVPRRGEARPAPPVRRGNAAPPTIGWSYPED